jgi:extracellular elastinolytic metalloproteinase
MKKLLLLIIVMLTVSQVNSQVNQQDKDLVMGMIKSHAQAIGLTPDDWNNVAVSATYESPGGLRMIYLQQTFKGIPVFNLMQVLAFRNDKLVSITGRRLPFIEQLVNNSTGVPSIDAAEAVRVAMADQGLIVNQPIFAKYQDETKINFGDLGMAKSDIIATLVWLPVNEKEVRLTWQVELAPVHSADHLLLRIDAVSRKVLDKNNYTVYEQFNSGSDHAESQFNSGNDPFSLSPASPSVVNAATYRVIPYPAESPNHTGGTPALVTDPWNAAPGNATSLKWHYDGTTYHDSTRGNNVWAQEDRDNNNTTFGKTAISTTIQPNLTLDFTPNFTLAPTVTANQQFATTNLFYWNNIMHDITYLYGFNEPSGNFQANNQGRGGTGNDYVIADAQDAGGTNNANFSTPADGSRPRMQMYLFTSVTPNRDGDLDNGIIAHEYGHGVSNRLTGGPANSSCLGNAEQGGEGWSDFLALMTTTNWATANLTDGALAKPIGTYALAQAITGAGIRTYPYSTNMAINPWTYAMMAGTSGQVHVIGEIWCTALWEMTWELIAMDGINPNLFNPSATGGNSAALKLVIEGMRLQPCSPGYIDARNAILKADTLFFGAKYSCAIWKAFAKRGMGKFASQGSSNSTTDQVADFTDNGSVSLLLTQSVTQQLEGLNITYTNHVSAGSCTGIANYTLRDTLPPNVTYVSGGSYDAGNRVVSFPVNLGVGQSQDYNFTVSVNPGSYYAPVLLLDETVAGTTIPASWTINSTTSTNWAVSNAQSTSPPNSFFSLNIVTASDQTIQSTNPISLPASPPKLTFQGYINSEANWDGGVVEISTNNGSTWTDLGPNFISGGYNGNLNSSGTNPLRGKAAFTGTNGGFVKSTVNLASYAGQNVKFRFRFGSDESVAGVGWYIDDIQLKDISVVNMRSNLFNANNVRLTYSDTVALILPCVQAGITTQPSPATVCRNANATFTVEASGTGLTYQWQSSTNGGVSFSNIPSANSNTLTLNAVTPAMNNYRYQCIINGDCTTNLISNAVILTINDPVAPAGQNGFNCGTGSVAIAASPGVGETIDWYSNLTGGSALQTGSFSYLTGTISSTTTYYAESRNLSTGCVSATRTAVVAAIGANSSSTTAISICSDQLPYVWNNTSFTQGGIYTVSFTNASGCDSAARLLLDVAAILTVYNVTGGGSYSTGGTGVPVGLSGSQPGILYQLVLGGTTNIGQPVTGTGNAISFGNQTATGQYSVIATQGLLCPQPMNGSVSVTIVSGPPASYTVTGGGTYCTGTTGLDIGLAGSQTGVNYQLKRSNGTINVGAPVPGTGNPISFGLQTVADTYTVLATNNSNLLTQAMSNSVFIRVALLKAPSTPGAISGPTDACPYIGQGNAVYSIAQASNATSYIWTAPAGANIIGSNSDTTVIVQYTASFVSGNLSVAAVNSCFGNATSATRNLAITKKVPSAPGAINSSLTNVCPVTGTGSTVSYSINKVNYATSYSWSVSAGMNIISIVSDTTVFVSFNSGFTTGTIGVVANNNCSSSSQRVLTVKATLPTTPSAIIGSSNVCSFVGQLTPATYSVSPVSGAASYLWTAPANSTITAGQGTASIELSFNANFTGGTLTVKAIAACGNSSVRSLSLTKNVPSTPGTITPSVTNVCPLVGTGNTARYFINKVNYATAYNWTVTSGMNIVSVEGDTAVFVGFNNGFTTGTIAVVASNNCASSSQRSLTVKSTAPTTPVAISGPTNVCTYVGQPVTASYSIDPVNGASSYLWTAPVNSTVVTGHGTENIELSFASNFAGGSLTVKAVAACGSSSSRSLSLIKTVAKPGPINSSASACPLSTVTYSIDPVPFATSYQWSVPTNATYISGQGTTSFTVSFKATFVSGTVTVKSVNACASSAASTLSLSAAGCTALRQPIESKNDGGAESATVFPNPSNGVFTFMNIIHPLQNGKIKLRLSDLAGRVVLEKEESVGKNGISVIGFNLPGINSGIYRLAYSCGKEWEVIKVAIIK